MNIFQSLIKPEVVSRALRIKKSHSVNVFLNTLTKEAREFYRKFPRERFSTNFFGKRKDITVGTDKFLDHHSTLFFKSDETKPFSFIGQNIKTVEYKGDTCIRRTDKIRYDVFGKKHTHQRVTYSTNGELSSISNRYYESIKTQNRQNGYINWDTRLINSNFTDYTQNNITI